MLVLAVGSVACVTSSGTYGLPSSVCVCVCMCTLMRVCGLASQSSAETNASATQGWNFRLFLYTHCWLWEARPEPTDRSGFFLKVCFLASAHGIPVVELRFQSFSWPMTFFKKGQGIYHTFCVYIYVIYHTMNCRQQGTEMG